MFKGVRVRFSVGFGVSIGSGVGGGVGYEVYIYSVITFGLDDDCRIGFYDYSFGDSNDGKPMVFLHDESLE